MARHATLPKILEWVNLQVTILASVEITDSVLALAYSKRSHIAGGTSGIPAIAPVNAVTEGTPTMLCRQPAWRRARRASAFVSMTILLFVVPVMAAVAETGSQGAGSPGAAESAAASRPTVWGMPVITGAWALFGAMALLAGLIVASRGARAARRSAHPVRLDPQIDAVGAGVTRADGPIMSARTSPAV